MGQGAPSLRDLQRDLGALESRHRYVVRCDTAACQEPLASQAFEKPKTSGNFASECPDVRSRQTHTNTSQPWDRRAEAAGLARGARFQRLGSDPAADRVVQGSPVWPGQYCHLWIFKLEPGGISCNKTPGSQPYSKIAWSG